MKLEAGEARDVGRTHIIKRPRLTRLLDQTDARVILLIAPAGYGKTTLAREWLAERSSTWYRGSPGTADVAGLALGVAAAAGTIIPGAGERLRAYLRVSRTPTDEVKRLVSTLAADFENWPEDAWLVFDDYQFACDSEAAERFVEHLARESHLKLLIASRTRPRWAKARLTLYGEVFEIGRSLLAMSNEEAEFVLSGRSPEEADAFLSLADGWPALIALRSVATSRDMPGEIVPEELYAFFTEELYSAAIPSVQRGLRRLSLAPYVTGDIAAAVLKDDLDDVITQGIELGFFSLQRRGRLEFHPLLRAFLSSKFRMRLDDPTGERITALAQVLNSQEAWDDVFELASRFGDDAILVNLFEAALDQLLEEARVSTLEHWIAKAQSKRIDSPIIDLAEAELALRRGDFATAEALACQAVRRFDREHAKLSRALWIAGTSAHLTDNDEASAHYFTEAEEVASCDEDASRAVWGQFLAADFLERNAEAAALLATLVSRSAHTVDERLRISIGTMRTAFLSGELRAALDEAEALNHLVERSRDPLIRSSFLQSRAYLLNICGRYEDGLLASKCEIDYVRSTYLDFVLPYGHLNAAFAQLGLRQFREAKQSLSQCGRMKSSDFVTCNMQIGRARMSLATLQFEDALATLDHAYPFAEACPTVHAEYLAWWSLAHAAAGNGREAHRRAGEAESLSQRIEVSALVPWTRAVMASNGPSARRSAWTALEIALATANINAFVTAYRAHPRLLELLIEERGALEKLKTILTRANDYGIAGQVGIPLPLPRDMHLPSDLSRREREVLDLVCQGLLNKEIARTLFITEATVKVHVRKICQKLGVRSRTEAAMRAAEVSD